MVLSNGMLPFLSSPSHPDVVACLPCFRDRRSPVETVKVPQMAESITEGTLKAWTKKVGDTVATDEEVASIETDKVRIVVFAFRVG
jgi:hypothetical protein